MTIDRRKFLTTAALGAVGTMIPLDKEAEAGNVSGYQPRFVMIFDQNKCVGCGACKEACSETNNVPAGQLRMTLERQSPLDGTPGNRKYVRVSCQQCSEPPCVRVCPTGAAHIDPATNIVTMDNDRCVGCKYCIAGCPYIIDNTEKSEQQELVEDLVQIITVFSCKLQGKRANKAKKLIRELIQEETDGKSHKSNADTKQRTEN